MRAQLDTAILLAEAPRPRTSRERTCAGGTVLFLAHRAADGWLALDLTGEEVARFAPRRGEPWSELPILCGGLAYPDRVFALYACDADPASCGGLRVPAPGPLRIGFGGDMTALLRRCEIAEGPMHSRRRRLLLFRGLSVLPGRARAIPGGASIARSTPELLFETPRGALWAEVRRLALATSPTSTETRSASSARHGRTGGARRSRVNAYGT